MTLSKKIIIQGYPGCFHGEAATRFFGDHSLDFVPADSFNILADKLDHQVADTAIMAIENSIAGSILQNYRILREHGFWISGEIYHRIEMNLMALPNTKLEDIEIIESHPMALSQCIDFLSNHKDKRLVESEDTALSAIKIERDQLRNKACIASKEAARLYNLDLLAEGIETNKLNYTRFFILQKERQLFDESQVDKASLYIKIPDVKGQLLKVLQCIQDLGLNMSKLQSFPVMGTLREYFFYMDVEFDKYEQFQKLIGELFNLSTESSVLGVYKRDAFEQTINQANTNKI